MIMHRISATLLAALLASCSSDADRYRAADYRLLCDLNGRAFVSTPNVGDNSVVTRAPDADETCNITRDAR
jgi:hypothetical protein